MKKFIYPLVMLLMCCCSQNTNEPNNEEKTERYPTHAANKELHECDYDVVLSDNNFAFLYATNLGEPSEMNHVWLLNFTLLDEREDVHFSHIQSMGILPNIDETKQIVNVIKP